MASLSTKEVMEMVPDVIKLSNIISECCTYSLEASKLLYTSLFVQEAKEKNKLPAVLDEIEENWKKNPLTLYEIIPFLIDYYADQDDPDWCSARSYIVPENFRPLPSLYYSVRNDIQYLRQNHDERKAAYQELQSEYQEFANKNPDVQCPVSRKYATLQRLAPPETVWQVKKDAFGEIFQRTRELFLFHDEEAHFHHAARLLDYWQSALERKNKPDTRRDEGAFKKQAREMKTLQKAYIDALERIQRTLKMDEVVNFVTNRMKLSKDFTSVRNTVSKRFEKVAYLLEGIEYVVPARVEQDASLASSLYVALHERQKLHDDLKRTTAKLKNIFLQVQAWENLTRTEFDVAAPPLGQPSSQPLVNQPQLNQPEVIPPPSAQEQVNRPRTVASSSQTINNNGINQSQANNSQSRETNKNVPQQDEPVQLQTSNPLSTEVQTLEQYGELLEPRELTDGEIDRILQAYHGESSFPGPDEHFATELDGCQLNESQVREPQVTDPQASEPHVSEEQTTSSPRQESEQPVQGQVSNPELLAFLSPGLGEAESDQGQLTLQQVGNSSEPIPEENGSSQPQNTTTAGEAPEADQDSSGVEDLLQNAELQQLMDPLAVNPDDDIRLFNQELVEGFDSAFEGFDATTHGE